MARDLSFDKPGQRVVDVTPNRAKQWLLLNKHNRKIKSVKISQYARDMREGNWQFTGEAIQFNEAGELINGQNRLHAIIDAQVTIPILVVTGLEGRAQQVMDAGAIRTAGDALHLNGYKYPNEVAGAVRAHWMWQGKGLLKACIMPPPSGNLMPTTSEILTYVKERPELAKAAVETRPVSRQLRLPNGGVAAAYFEFWMIQPDEAKDFLDRIDNHRTLGKGDPINTLIKRCDDMADQREHVRAPLAIFMLVTAWNAVRLSETFEKFQFGSEARGWAPIPQPK